MAFPGMSNAASALRDRFERRSRQLRTTRIVRESLVSVAGLVGRPVLDHTGVRVGRLVDVVARWNTGDEYPPLAGLVVRVGSRRVFVTAASVAEVGQDRVVLSTARLDLRDFTPRAGEAALVRDVLDHQLVDVDGARVVRANDLYLARVGVGVRLVGLDVGAHALLRRLGPARWRTRPNTDAVIDWAGVHSFGPGGGPGRVRLGRHRSELSRLRPGELADLLEDLGRAQRQQLLDVVEPDAAADAVEEMDAGKVHQLLKESPPAHAADLLARMEPDEAADALRDLRGRERDRLLERMPAAAGDAVRSVLGHSPDVAGGIMTTVLVTVHHNDRVADLRDRLRAQATHVVDLEGVAVVDDDGRLVDDVSFGELLLADPDTTLGELTGEPWPVVVPVDTPVSEIAARLIDARRLSVLVVDDQQRPVGRILADDIVDALVGKHGWLRLPGRR